MWPDAWSCETLASVRPGPEAGMLGFGAAQEEAASRALLVWASHEVTSSPGLCLTVYSALLSCLIDRGDRASTQGTEHWRMATSQALS